MKMCRAVVRDGHCSIDGIDDANVENQAMVVQFWKTASKAFVDVRVQTNCDHIDGEADPGRPFYLLCRLALGWTLRRLPHHP